MSRKKKIMKRMKQMKLSNSQVASYAMLSVDAFILWLDAKIVIPFHSIMKISNLLDLESDDIMNIV